MKVEKAIDLIKKFEGLRLKIYQCQAGYWTIGYGTRASRRKYERISIEQANELLILDIEKIVKRLNKLLTIELSENQFNALISLIYNIGIGAFARSNLLKLINLGDFKQASTEFDWFYYTDPKTKEKKKSDGLIRRRKAERKLFNS